MVICLCTNQKLPTCSTAAFHRYHVWLGQQFPAPTGFVKSITEQAAPSYSKKFPSGQCCGSLPPANQRSAGAEATAWRRTAHRQLLAAVVAMVSAKVLRVLWTQLFPFRKWVLVIVNAVSCTHAAEGQHTPRVWWILPVLTRDSTEVIEMKSLKTALCRLYRPRLICSCVGLMFGIE